MNEGMPTLPDQQKLRQVIEEQPQTKEKKGFLKALALLEVGLIEIFFVAIVLILIFGILNYFNILKLSAVFPNQLGFLPHKIVSLDESNKDVTMIL